MGEYGWRTLVIDSACSLAYDNGSVVVRKDTDTYVPLEQIRSIVVNTSSVSVTASLMNELAKAGICTVFCDDKHNPSFELSTVSRNFASAGNILAQSKWNDDIKTELWKHIVELKIRSQIAALSFAGANIPDKMYEYASSVEADDVTNREGQAARVYFNAMFGYGFVRRSDDDVNAALNYGYSLILSSFNRIVTLHGYHTALGIKHCSAENRFNLSCDLMEPFRPMIDVAVRKNSGKPLDWEYRKELISVLQSSVRYGGRKMLLTDAMELFALDVFAVLSGEAREIKEVSVA